jgi:regulator of sigma E protease
VAHFVLYYVLPFIAMMFALVGIHEGGHFLVARLLGIRVISFSIGMGRKLFSFTDRTGCEWRVGALPIGGYVKMYGDDDAASVTSSDAAVTGLGEGERGGVFRLRPPLHRMAVAAAGPIANFVFGFVVVAVVASTYGMMYAPSSVADVVPDSPAAAAGLDKGDAILAIDGRRVSHFEDLVRVVSGSDGRPLRFTVRHDGAVRGVVIAPAKAVSEDGAAGWRIGVSSPPRQLVRLAPVAAVRAAADSFVQIAESSLRGLGEVVTFNRPIKDVGGPVKIAEVGGDVLSSFGLMPFLLVCAFISVNLGVVNLLPFPILDGGHIVLLAVEAVRGRPIEPQAAAMLFRGGAVVLMLFFVAVTASDVTAILARALS